MKLKSKDYGCPSCGATLKYSPERQKLYCEKCETCVDIIKEKVTEKHSWEERKKFNTKAIEKSEEERVLKCVNCGANIKLNSLEFSKKCPYCDTNIVGVFTDENKLVPDTIIPFKYSLEEAKQLFAKGFKKKMFIPRELKKNCPVDNLSGIYFPSYSYDSHTESDYKGVLATDHTYTDSQGNRKTRTTYKHISGHQIMDLKDVLVETSTKLDQIEMNKIQPYNMEEMVKFDNGFILGYSVEDFEKTIDQCKEIADNIMKNSIKRAILSKYSYDRVSSFSMTTAFTNEKYMYYLLPLYENEYTYNNKKYRTIMNGQTGKLAGKVPRSPVKITFFVLFILAIIGGIVGLIVALS